MTLSLSLAVQALAEYAGASAGDAVTSLRILTERATRFAELHKWELIGAVVGLWILGRFVFGRR